MKKIILIPLTVLVSLLIFSSCEENSIEVEPELPFDYIKFEIDGEEYLFTESKLETHLHFDVSANETYIILNDSLDNYGARIFISSFDITNTEYPFQFPDKLTAYNTPNVGVQLINLQIKEPSTFGPNDSTNYSGQTYDGLTFILTSFENNILKGEFSGEIKTRTGLVKTVEEGEFKANLKLR